MQQVHNLNIEELEDFLLHVSTHRPVFIWGAPGIGKSTVVQKVSNSWGMECVTLLGSQLAPEDLIGVPQISKNSFGMDVSKFIPPSVLVRQEPFVLFLDELNLASNEVRKAFYSLILDQRVGELVLPKGSIVIGAGNRAADSALVGQLNSALVSRMVHVTMAVNNKIWLNWAKNNNIYPLIIDFISANPSCLSTEIPPAEEKVFSTPRTWHALSDILNSYNGIPNEKILKVALQGTISAHHAVTFEGFCKLEKEKYKIHDIIEGKSSWPFEIEKRDVLLYLVNSFRQILLRELPQNTDQITGKKKELVHKVRAALESLANIDKELVTQIIVEDESGKELPSWFVLELSKDSSLMKELSVE